MPGEKFGERKVYLTVVQGMLKRAMKLTPDQDGRLEIPEGVERRDYETSDGKKGFKYEESYRAWSGRIEDLRIKDTDFGEALEVVFEDAILTISVGGSYFSDFVQRIASADINKPVTVSPYDFEVDGRRLKGFSIKQDGVKLESFYWNKETKESLNGIPVAPPNAKASYSKAEWKIFFAQVSIFLTKEIARIKEGIKKKSLEDVLAEKEKNSLYQATQEADGIGVPGEEIIIEGVDDVDDSEIKLSDVPF